MSLLSVDQLVVSYGDSQVLTGVGFDLQEGEIVALVGATAPARPRCYAH
jgi:ABC-type branched-subunit amino acid transport system ATPase component